jgi:flagellar hook-associated protein 3 FlgL
VNVRVAGQTQTNNAIVYMRQRAADLAKYQDQVSSGLRVKLPSDDPSVFTALSQSKAASARLGAYTQNVSESTAVLNSGVSTLQDVNDALVRAKQIALEGADSTANSDPNGTEALAVEVDGLIDRVLRSANSQPDGKSLFGGTAITTQPFRVATTDAQGRPLTIAYDGATDRTRTLTGPNQTVDTRYDGSQVFQQPGADVFQSLIALRDQLRDTTLSGTARAQAFQQHIGAMDTARNAIGETTAEQASTLAALESVQSLTAEVKLTADTRIGELAGTDYAEAVVKMQEQETALQAIYATTSRLLQPGFLDFIR